MTKRISISLCSAVAMFLHIGPGQSVELGLTPSHVVGLWSNVNDCVDAAVKSVAKKQGLDAQVSAISLDSFEGKKPSHVLGKVAVVRDKIDKLRKKAGLGKVAVFKNPDGKITPSVVYLNSGHVLDGLADWVARNASSGQLVADCYRAKKFSGKTPSHAFGMVDLANRRLDLVLAALAH